MKKLEIVKKTEEYPDNLEGNRIVIYEGLFFADNGQEIRVFFDDEYNIVTPGINLLEWSKVKLFNIKLLLNEIVKYLQDQRTEKRKDESQKT